MVAGLAAELGPPRARHAPLQQDPQRQKPPPATRKHPNSPDKGDTSSRAEYRFLHKWALSEPMLDHACNLARKWNSTPHEVLISLGWLEETTYCQALAQHLGVGFEAQPPPSELIIPQSKGPNSALPDPVLAVMLRNGQRLILLNGRSVGPDKLAHIIATPGHPAEHLAITTQKAMRGAHRYQFGQNILARARDHLAESAPVLSSSTGLWPSQALTIAMLLGALAGAFAMAPKLTLIFITALLTLPFLSIVLLRLISMIITLMRKTRDKAEVREPIHPAQEDQAMPDAEHLDAEHLDAEHLDAGLPVYSILVPLYKEHEVLPGLINALKMLRYPATKLDIKIILESSDPKTIEVAHSLNLPGNFDIIIVPDASPRTKPKALNYALEYARGDFVVIYDAEDEPEPDQLRRALAMFRSTGPDTACIQAQLNIYNSHENWLTRQFTIEYTSLFDGLLPSFDSLALPILLGGTSNHFRTGILRKIGGWDPYNVTEDADLGIRLMRRGLRCHILQSTTYEEAPDRFVPWLKQRTRWLKGWMQTFLVHTRNTARFRRDVGSWRYFGFQAILGGTILSALIHPLFYVGLVIELTNGHPLTKPSDLIGSGFWHAALFNLSAGYFAAIALGWVTVYKRGLPKLMLHTLTMPVYWILTSIAAYRALFQLFSKPFLWEKTKHKKTHLRASRPMNVTRGTIAD